MTDTLVLAADIVTSYVGGPAPVEARFVPVLITSVHAALLALTPGVKPAPAAPVRNPPVPAVDAKASVFRNEIVCLECGARLVMLRRHLREVHALEPTIYRRRWNLPETYPMVSPDYSKARSTLAKASGLGKKGRNRWS